MMAYERHIPSISLLVASLLGSQPRRRLLANAASAKKENEVKAIYRRMEADALAFRDEIERVYLARCETHTLLGCAESNFNDCSSTFANQQCMKANEIVISACGDGIGCNALWDKELSTVSIPASLSNAPFDNPSDPEIIESACYSLLAEPYMIEKYKADEEYWAKYNIQPSWTYFGAHNGLFRKVPAIHQEYCGEYDPRRRPWFVAASSGPKDVVLVIDTSGSMNQYGRMNIAKEAAITIISTLTVGDRAAVISFSDSASQVGGYDTLIRATSENKIKLIEAIKNLEANGATNFYDAFDAAFNALDKTISSEATTGCNIALLFMTDGDSTVGPGKNEVINLVNNRTDKLAADFSRETKVFTFSLGKEADHEVTKSIACSTNGVWTPVSDLTGDLVTAMSSYYKLFALGLGEGGNEDFAAWVEPYEYHNPKGRMGTTVSVPVYDRSVEPPLFLGVVAVDSYMDALESVLGEDATSSTMLERFILLSTARCPKIKLTECELDALRYLGGGTEATCGVCNNTSFSGIVPEKCPFQSNLPNNLWHNTDLEGREYGDRACCRDGGTAPSADACPVLEKRSASVSDGNSSTGIIAGAAVAGIFFIVAAALIIKRFRDSKAPQKHSMTTATGNVESNNNDNQQATITDVETLQRMSSSMNENAHMIQMPNSCETTRDILRLSSLINEDMPPPPKASAPPSSAVNPAYVDPS